MSILSFTSVGVLVSCSHVFVEDAEDFIEEEVEDGPDNLPDLVNHPPKP